MPAYAGTSSKPIQLLAGTSHPKLAEAVAQRLGIQLTPMQVGKFSAGETSVSIGASLRDCDCYILQSPRPGFVNDNFVETLVIASACRTASAARITVIMPFFPYSRMDKKDSGRKPITAKLCANLLTTAGADHVVSLDLHSSQLQGFFDIPVDNLASENLMASYIKNELGPAHRECVIVSPDAGGAKRATSLADKLGVEFSLVHRTRTKKQKNPHFPGTATPLENSTVPSTPFLNHSEHTRGLYSGGGGMSSSFHLDMMNGNGSNSVVNVNGSKVDLGIAPGDDEEKPDKLELLVGDVRGKVCFVVDDMIDSGHTLRLASKVLKEAGAKDVYALVSHGLLSDTTMQALKNITIKRLVVTNSIDQSNRLAELGEDFMHIIDVAPLIAEAIRRTHNGESISALFRSDPF